MHTSVSVERDVYHPCAVVWQAMQLFDVYNDVLFTHMYPYADDCPLSNKKGHAAPLLG